MPAETPGSVDDQIYGHVDRLKPVTGADLALDGFEEENPGEYLARQSLSCQNSRLILQSQQSEVAVWHLYFTTR